jgi:hypothetical protein
VACIYAGSTSPGAGINLFDGAGDSASAGIRVLTYAGNNSVTAPVGGTLETNTIAYICNAWTGNGANDGVVIISSLTISGGVYDGDGLPMSFSIAAIVASQTYVDVLTPGVSDTAASGTVYPTLFAAAPPALGIVPTTNGVTLFWPVTTTIYRLQQNSDLTTTNWVASLIPVNAVNGTNQVTFSPVAGNLFFRLINP